MIIDLLLSIEYIIILYSFTKAIINKIFNIDCNRFTCLYKCYCHKEDKYEDLELCLEKEN